MIRMLINLKDDMRKMQVKLFIRMINNTRLSKGIRTNLKHKVYVKKKYC